MSRYDSSGEASTDRDGQGLVPRNVSRSHEITFEPSRISEGTATRYREGSRPRLAFEQGDRVRAYVGDALVLLSQIADQYSDGVFDMIFADPPYFLSNGGVTCHAGQMVSVDKGGWDKSRGVEADHEFTVSWLKACRQALKADGTIWVSGTSHIIYSAGFAMQKLGYKILNDIAWVKPNPPPNLSCRYFTHSTETVLWAAKSVKSRHTFNYAEMKHLAGGKQMKNVWEIAPPSAEEKRPAKHPTQKPLALLERILLASTSPGDLVFDPFMGSGTTGVAAVRTGRRFVGIDVEPTYVTLAEHRLKAALGTTALFD